jgi:hypothetical protein
MLTLNSFNERTRYGICQGYNIGYRNRTLTLPVHLVHAPSPFFWSSPSYSFTFSFMCGFFQFLSVTRCFVSVFLASSLSLKKLTLNFGCRFNRTWFVVTLDFTFTQTTTQKNRYGKCYGYNNH